MAVTGDKRDFFWATTVWDDEENIEDNECRRLFCARSSEDELKPGEPNDNDIFHYGLDIDSARAIVGKSGDITGEGEFTILDVCEF